MFLSRMRPRSGRGVLDQGSLQFNAVIKADTQNFVFLKVFKMQWGIYHSAVLSCPVSSFGEQEQTVLMQLLHKNSPYEKVPGVNWQNVPAVCEQIEFGGSKLTEAGSGIMYSHARVKSHLAFMHTRHFEEAWLYVYGTSTHRAYEVRKLFVDRQLDLDGKYFAGSDYGLISMNCNTFTSEVLACAYGFSHEKPFLGVSDMVNVACGQEPALQKEAANSTAYGW